jgi:hypothetical protein
LLQDLTSTLSSRGAGLQVFWALTCGPFAAAGVAIAGLIPSGAGVGDGVAGIEVAMLVGSTDATTRGATWAGLAQAARKARDITGIQIIFRLCGMAWFPFGCLSMGPG